MDACFDCGDIALTIRPGASLGDLVAIFTNKGGLASKDPDFKPEMEQSLKYVSEHPEAVSAFKPSSSVMNTHSYGFSIFQDVAAITEQEYCLLTGRTAEALKNLNAKDPCKLEPVKVPLFGPGSNVMLYMVSLEEIPMKYWPTIRKARVYFGSDAQHAEQYLSASTQLHQKHGQDIFAYVAKMNQNARPESLRCTSAKCQLVAGTTPTLEELLQRHEELEAEIAAKLEQDAMDQDPLAVVERVAQPAAPVKRLGLGGGSLEVQMSKAKAKGAAGAKKRTKGPAPAAAASAAVHDEEDEDDGTRSRKSKKRDEGDRLKDSLDEDMALVLDRHINSGGSSAKCLEQLVPEQFLLGIRQGDKALSLTLTGVWDSAVLLSLLREVNINLQILNLIHGHDRERKSLCIAQLCY